MTERMEHEEFDRLLAGRAGSGDGEIVQLAKLARALERTRPPLATPSEAFRAALRDKVVGEAVKEGVVIPLSLAGRVRASAAARNTRMRRSFRQVVAIAAAAAMLLVSGSAFALTASSLPGEAGYPMMRFRERLQKAVAFGNAAKAYKELDFARKRLDEVKGLRDAGVENSPPYVRALTDMDASTTEATSRLIREYRATDDTAVLQPLVRFSAAQRQALEGIFANLPPSARPAARSSIELVVAVQDRVSDVLGGCPCSSDIFTPAGTTLPAAEAPCACTATGTEPTGVPKRQPPASDRPADPSPKDDGDDTPEPPARGIVPPIEGTNADETVNDLVDGVLDLVPSPIATILPLP